MAAEELRRGVDDHVGAQRQRLLQQRRRERVVDDHARAGLARRGADRGHVGDVEQRVRRRLEPHQVGLEQLGDPGLRVRRRDALDPPRMVARAGLGDPGDALVAVVGNHEVRAGRQLAQHGVARRHTGRERHGVAALEPAEDLLEGLPGVGRLRAAVQALGAQHEVRCGDERSVQGCAGHAFGPATHDGPGLWLHRCPEDFQFLAGVAVRRAADDRSQSLVAACRPLDPPGFTSHADAHPLALAGSYCRRRGSRTLASIADGRFRAPARPRAGGTVARRAVTPMLAVGSRR